MTQAKIGPSMVGSDWVLCHGCGAVIYQPRWVRNLHVCVECGWHGRVGALERIRQLLDVGSVAIQDLPTVDTDPLDFVDSKPYPDRIRAARSRTGLSEAVVCASGTIMGYQVLVAAMDFDFFGGSLGTSVGEFVTRLAEQALRERTPLLLVSASGGARMQEGALSLMQMAKTSQALGMLDDAGVLTISLVTDPTYGGVAASFATLCDVIIAEPRARLGFAGPRVIEQILRQRLPTGFQTAEHLLSRGMIDAIQPRSTLRQMLSRLLAVAANDTEPISTSSSEIEATVTDPDRLAVTDPWEVVKRARDLQRPTTLDYVSLLISDFEELRGDRASGDCPAIVGGIGHLAGRAVMLIGHQKAHDVQELAARNYGMPAPSGYRKAARLMKLAEKLALPIVTFVDTPGAHPGIEAEEHGQAIAIAENLKLMAKLRTPVVSVILGEGGSGGALALAVANNVLMCENATYSVISPEGCAAILWADSAAAPRAAAALRMNSAALLRLGIVDGVIGEPQGGSSADHRGAADRVANAVVAALDALTGLSPEELVAHRYARFRAFGQPSETTPWQLNEEGT